MKPRITVLTLGVSDLEQLLAFYRDGLGLPTEGIVGQEYEHGAVAFFKLQDGLMLALDAQYLKAAGVDHRRPRHFDPHAGRAESLNVAMATTLLVFEVARQRRSP